MSSAPASSVLAMSSASAVRARSPVGEPVAIVDIGSNSVRLVAYEGGTRAPTPIFNEKVLCGLGRGVSTSGRLSAEGVERALKALKRFRILCRSMGVRDLCVLATAAARDAANGPDFLQAAREAIGCDIELLSGEREATLAALGVVSSIHAADGVAGDLGGGSLELSDVHDGKVDRLVSLPIGGLALSDRSGRSPKKATKIVREALADCRTLDALPNRAFYAIGGTWRSLARVHMLHANYPLHVMHGYTIPAADALAFVRTLQEDDAAALVAAAALSPARAPLLTYGALLLEQIIRSGNPREIVFSALGVREGALYERLPEATRRDDPLLSAAREINILTSRSPQHGEDLIAWTDDYFKSSAVIETAEEARLRHAVCLMADIGWRAQPDYRAEQAFNSIRNAVFIGIDHPGRTFLSMAVAYRHLAPDAVLGPTLDINVAARAEPRARLLGAAMRIAYVVSAATPGVLPRTSLRMRQNKLVLTLSADLADLASEKLLARLKQFGKLVDREASIVIG